MRGSRIRPRATHPLIAPLQVNRGVL